MIDPTETDPATVAADRPHFENAPAPESDDVEGHGRPATFEVAAEPTDEDDVEGHGRGPRPLTPARAWRRRGPRVPPPP